MSDSKSPKEELYAQYSEWKSWNDGARTPGGFVHDVKKYELEQNEIEYRRAQVPPGTNVFEIGFGSGLLLDWCRSAGHDVYGVEIIPEMVERAQARGHKVALSNGLPPDDMLLPKFGLIAALDVFEHLTVEELRAWLVWMSAHLAPSGKVMARFPNGSSPFGRHYQSGDLTHRLTLNASSLAQVAGPAGLRIVKTYNAARTFGGVRSRILKVLAYKCRDLIEAFMTELYFKERLPMDPNITVILEADERATGGARVERSS